MLKKAIAVAVLATFVPVPAWAQARWLRRHGTPTPAGGGATNPIDPARRIDWVANAPGASIPVRNTTCVTAACNTMTAAGTSATAAQINAALNSAPANTVVQLAAGTYSINANLTTSNDNVTLRGAGGDSTFLISSGGAGGCQGKDAVICATGNDLGYYTLGPPTHVVNWTAGYAKGSTQLTLSATTGLSTGMYIEVDQLNDASDTGDVYVCQAKFTCTDEDGSGNARTGRAQRQMVKVTNIAGNVVTITPGIQMPNWRSGQTPQAWWGNSGSLSTGIGIENLSIDATAANERCITLIMTTNSWISGVRCLFAANGNGSESHIHLFQVSHVTVKDSYLYGSTSFAGGSQTYGIEMFGACDSLVQNNIVQHRTSPFVRDGDCGSVLAYNYTFDDYYPTSPTFLQGDLYSHEGGNGMILTEGNEGLQIKQDVVHATNNLFTFFRNYVRGGTPTINAESSAVKLYARSRYHNLVGNVLGNSSFHNQYEWSVSGANQDSSIYSLGSATNNSPSDSLVKATLMRWGNCDSVTGFSSCVFNSAEVPSGLSVLPNPVPANNNLPASFYLPAKPSWWTSTTPWPAIGPDVTGGDVSNVGGRVYKNPAHQCWDASTPDTNYAVDASGLRPIHFACTYPLS